MLSGVPATVESAWRLMHGHVIRSKRAQLLGGVQRVARLVDRCSIEIGQYDSEPSTECALVGVARHVTQSDSERTAVFGASGGCIRGPSATPNSAGVLRLALAAKDSWAAKDCRTVKDPWADPSDES